MEGKLPLLEKIIAQKKEEQEQVRLRILALTIEALKSVAPRFAISEAYVTGSLCQEGRFHSHSDIDIAVAGLTKANYFTFMAAMQDLLPIQIEVIELENCRFAEKIIKNGIKVL
jgi:predicted nucleotidyltransferase